MTQRPHKATPLLEEVLRDRLAECIDTTEQWPSNALALARASAERAVIGLALSSHGYNLTRTAASLGISRKTLYSRMRQYGLNKEAAGNGAGVRANGGRANGDKKSNGAGLDGQGRRRALVSVYDKSGMVDLCRRLAALDIEILATGGTARALADAAIPYTSVDKETGVAEMMDGRVKTLHPNIFAPLLARLPQDAQELEAAGLHPIDFVIVNLYPFSEALEQDDSDHARLCEFIDIGGVSLLRAGAKSHERVCTLCQPAQYAELLEALESGPAPDFGQRARWAAEALAHTSGYDRLIGSWLKATAHGAADKSEEGDAEAVPERLQLLLSQSQPLRYGENPHQGARLFPDQAQNLAWRQHQGIEASYNNLCDSDCALALVQRLPAPACVIIKHDTPCAVACGDTALASFERAFASDSESAFGGIIAFNTALDDATAEAIVGNVFTEIVIAPEFSDKALKAFAKKAKLRLFSCSMDAGARYPMGIKRVHAGYLVQEAMDTSASLSQAGAHACPDASKDLQLAWEVVAAVRSNAIVAVCDGRTVGISGGQTSRIRAVHQALDSAAGFLEANPAGKAPLVLASDAFFPFADSVDRAAASGVRAIVQPGGSIRDKEVIAAADKHGIALYFTGKRVFRH